MTIYIVMCDDTQTVCPVEANNPNEARELIAAKLGRDVGNEPIYNTDKEEDIEAIVSILKAHLENEVCS